MKMLAHRTTLSENEPFQLEDLQDHIRVDASEELEAILRMGWAAAHEIEQFAQIALLKQTVRVTIFEPSANQSGLRLPIGPVSDDDTPTVTIDGEPFSAFDFIGGNRPYIRWLAAYQDLSPDRITIEYTAGFGDTYDAIPPDLYQAMLDQAALHYDGRSPMEARELTTSPHMARIGARYRGVQS